MIGQKRFIALLLNAKDRKEGSMIKDGKTIAWGAGFQLVTLGLGEDQIQKYMVAPDCVEKVRAKLEQLHWGCAVELKIVNKKVCDVTVLDDVLKDYCDEN